MSLENSYVLRGKIVSVQAPDTTLTIAGAPADAKTVGDLLRNGGIVGVSPEISAHLLRVDNPHKVTKRDVGLSNVDNTADLEKPVSRPQQEAISKIGDGLIGKVNEHEEALKTKASVAQVNQRVSGVSASVILSERDWLDKEISVTVEGVTAKSKVIVTPGENSLSVYSGCSIWCSGQRDGRLIFECKETPAENVTVNLLILDWEEPENDL